MKALWCKICRYHTCRCTGQRAAGTAEAIADAVSDRMGVAKVSYTEDGEVVVERVDPRAMLIEPPSGQYRQTLTMDDLRRNTLICWEHRTPRTNHGGAAELRSSVDLKERD